MSIACIEFAIEFTGRQITFGQLVCWYCSLRCCSCVRLFVSCLCSQPGSGQRCRPARPAFSSPRPFGSNSAQGVRAVEEDDGQGKKTQLHTICWNIEGRGAWTSCPCRRLGTYYYFRSVRCASTPPHTPRRHVCHSTSIHKPSWSDIHACPPTSQRGEAQHTLGCPCPGGT